MSVSLWFCLFGNIYYLCDTGALSTLWPHSPSKFFIFTDRAFVHRSNLLATVHRLELPEITDFEWSLPGCYNSLCCKPPCNIIFSCTGSSSTKCDLVAEKMCGSNTHCLLSSVCCMSIMFSSEASVPSKCLKRAGSPLCPHQADQGLLAVSLAWSLCSHSCEGECPV